jgi:hypothetical protein
VTRRCDVAERQIGELLDGVVADVTPRAADPVAEVLRRYRRYRYQVGVAFAAIMVVLAVGGFAAVPRFVGGGQRADVFASATPAEPTVPVQAGPAKPRVVGKEVVACGLVVPVPPGWHMIDDGKRSIATCRHAPWRSGSTLFLAAPASTAI